MRESAIYKGMRRLPLEIALPCAHEPDPQSWGRWSIVRLDDFTDRVWWAPTAIAWLYQWIPRAGRWSLPSDSVGPWIAPLIAGVAWHIGFVRPSQDPAGRGYVSWRRGRWPAGAKG